MNKKRTAVLFTVGLVLVLDQLLKLYIKTHFRIGESVTLIPNVFQLYFTENFGMAFGLSWGGYWGKYLLSIFRLIAIVFISYYIRGLIKAKAKTGFLVAMALILAGAIGNLIDSSFYGLIFNKGVTMVNGHLQYYYGSVAEFSRPGYAHFFQGSVVDMLQFTATWPKFIPGLGGNYIFSPIFNIADSAITIGVFIIILFNKQFLKQENPHKAENLVDTKVVD